MGAAPFAQDIRATEVDKIPIVDVMCVGEIEIYNLGARVFIFVFLEAKHKSYESRQTKFVNG